MISALGHCEDPDCSQSMVGTEVVRLFRCSIHCDRLLCLYHLNAHNVYYEEEKKQNDAVISELRNCLTIYQTIFEQHIQTYRELVHQASSLLLHNTSSIIPIEKIRPVLEQLQRAIAMFQDDNVMIKTETTLEEAEFDMIKVDSILCKDVAQMKEEPHLEKTKNTENGQAVIVRLQRVEVNTELQISNAMCNAETNKDQRESTGRPLNSESGESIHSNPNETRPHVLRPRKPTDENQRQDNSNKRALSTSPTKSTDKRKKRSEKIVPLKRLQT